MIQKRGNRFSLATNERCVCAKIMLKQRDESMIRKMEADFGAGSHANAKIES
jgi:hypothetical protein